jgi:hypothetical protein
MASPPASPPAVRMKAQRRELSEIKPDLAAACKVVFMHPVYLISDSPYNTTRGRDGNLPPVVSPTGGGCGETGWATVAASSAASRSGTFESNRVIFSRLYTGCVVVLKASSSLSPGARSGRRRSARRSPLHLGSPTSTVLV